MLSLGNLPTTEEMKAADLRSHMHPFTDHDALGTGDLRVITSASGVFINDSDGNQILDGMAGLWCVNVGYGRPEIGEAVSRQIAQLPYYNTFFKTTHPPVIALSEKLSQVAPEGINKFMFGSSGSDSNDTIIRLARTYWAGRGKPEKTIMIARHNAYHGSSMASASLGNAHVLPCKCVAVRSGGHHDELRSGEKMDGRRSFRHPSRARQRERSVREMAGPQNVRFRFT